MANRAPATAWGLSRPVTPPAPFAGRGWGWGWGSMLVRLEAASELAGRRGVGFGGETSAGLGGWREARLLLLLGTSGGAEN